MGKSISFTTSGSLSKTTAFLQQMQTNNLYEGLEGLAQRGVSALQAATPMDSGVTAASWKYEIKIENGTVTISWLNSNTVDGVNIAVILQYGHGTGTGGYINGRDYINPAIQPIFDEIANDIWEKVTTS